MWMVNKCLVILTEVGKYDSGTWMGIGIAKVASQNLSRIKTNSLNSLKPKKWVYNCYVNSSILYGSDSWRTDLRQQKCSSSEDIYEMNIRVAGKF